MNATIRRTMTALTTLLVVLTLAACGSDSSGIQVEPEPEPPVNNDRNNLPNPDPTPDPVAEGYKLTAAHVSTVGGRAEDGAHRVEAGLSLGHTKATSNRYQLVGTLGE